MKERVERESRKRERERASKEQRAERREKREETEKLAGCCQGSCAHRQNCSGPIRGPNGECPAALSYTPIPSKDKTASYTYSVRPPLAP